ncbi:glycosyltransferase family 1 protein [Nodosilinea sp. FACHB-131]|uniref:glycosyltransferase family 1 protein n=1 Tax=Cyanophyceae TaxID=3028117 RepID=UPI001687313D|nr:glycosyltransferase family 1 protein [Nodosilinea sp. FACHB-131]MBD1873992.1 glycosyltransferase family 1 protein [Nodosilinea sp. FACHB-131]
MNSRIYKEICQIVPRLSPSVDGVGDYALNLAHQLRSDFDINTNFVVCDPAWVGDKQLKGFQVDQVGSRSKKSLLAHVSDINPGSPILLHYVGYGYAKRGCPTWLVNGLKAWRHQRQQAHLVTMFHETSAFGPIWTSAFWLSATQRYLVKRLVRLSDRILTNKRSYAELLQSYAPERFVTIPTLPVFSNVGEPQNPSSLFEKTRRLVIFGGRSQRSKVYKDSLEQLRHICRYLDIQQIFDIGPVLDPLPADVDNVPITVAGCLPIEEVSTILSDSIAGFFSYHPAFLGKSTIFAAYCAHRVIPISATMSDVSEEGLQPGKHYALPEQYNTEKRDMALMQAIADRAYAWYQVHSLSAQAKAYYTLLSDLEVT